MGALQAMLLQAADGKIYVLPAWPSDWDVSFKLHAPGRTTVEAVYEDGKVRTLRIEPAGREKDVVICRGKLEQGE